MSEQSSTPQPGAPKPGGVPSPQPPVARPPEPPPRPAGPESPERRHFILTWLGLAWTAFALATLTALSTVLRFMFPNVLFEPKMTFKVGKPDEYEIGKVDLRWKEKYGVWVVRTLGGIYALSTVCTHLGCTPNWLNTEQKFKCPCHGSGFFKTGVNFEGPAPRPLERFAISLAEDGQVLINKSIIFQQEKGEWNDPLSFLTL